MNMKRTILAIVVFVLVLGYAFAGGKPEGEEAKTKEEVITLEMWGIATSGKPTASRFEKAIELWEAENPNIQINMVNTTDAAYKTKLKTAMGAGQLPDIIFSWIGTASHKPLVDAGLVIDMRPYMEQGGWLEEYSPASIASVTYDGGIYATMTMAGARTVANFYRSDIFKQVGLGEPDPLKPPAWDKYKSILQKLMGSGVTPYAFGNREKWPGSFWFMFFLDRIGGADAYPNAADADGTGSFTDSPFIEAGRRIQELVKMGAFGEGFNGRSHEDGSPMALLYRGDAAMMLQGDWIYGNFKKQDPETAAVTKTFPFPVVPGGVGNPLNTIGAPGGQALSVSKSSDHIEEAVEFLRFISTDDRIQEMIVKSGVLTYWKGFSGMIEDPVVAKLVEMDSQSPTKQLWIQEDLPAEVSEVYLNEVQAIFGGQDPAAAMQRLEDAHARHWAWAAK